MIKQPKHPDVIEYKRLRSSATQLLFLQEEAL